MAQDAGAIKVAVVGAGIAGLTTALRLSQRGYQVTLFDENSVLGGNLASHEHNGVWHDVYPHMYSNFYLNFWDIVENDLGLNRSAHFESRESFKFLGRDRVYRDLKDAGSITTMLSNMFSGIASPLDMYLWSYSMLDMIAHRFHDQGLLGQSVNGFAQSRPCTTDKVAMLHDFIVMVIWSVHSSDTAAPSYRNFLWHAFRNLNPLLWLLKGDLQQKLIGPLENTLTSLGCSIRKLTHVKRVILDGTQVKELELQNTQVDPDANAVELVGDPYIEGGFDFLVLAVPPVPLGNLIIAGVEGHRIVDQLPHLAEARRLRAEPIPIMDVYFKRKLDGIPRDNVAMTESNCELTFVDISQLWNAPYQQGITALTVGASDYWALPSENDHENGHAMIKELASYVSGFDPGKHWGDPNCDIDWNKTHYRSNKADTIFINEVESWEWRPETHYAQVPNLFFAGDCCRNKVDMATVEAAVTSGLNAAAALYAIAPRGGPIKILQPDIFPDKTLVALKLLMAPSAYAAKAWLSALNIVTGLSNAQPHSKWTGDLMALMTMPYAYATDWLQSVGLFWEDVLLGEQQQ